MAGRLSNTLEAGFCVKALTEALAQGRPEVFSTDQGSQFSSRELTQALQDRGVKISMDGKGPYADNIFVERLWRTVKYEEVYLKAYVNAVEARRELGTPTLRPVLTSPVNPEHIAVESTLPSSGPIGIGRSCTGLVGRGHSTATDSDLGSRGT